MGQHKLRAVLYGFGLAFLFLLLCPQDAKAAVHTIPANHEAVAWQGVAGFPSSQFRLDFSTVQSISAGSGGYYKRNSSGGYIICINTKTNDSGSVSDVATLHFANTGLIFGRQTDAIIRITGVTYNKPFCLRSDVDTSACSSGERGHSAVLATSHAGVVNVGYTKGGCLNNFGLDYCQHHQFHTTLQITVVWHDNQQPIPSTVPLYQTIVDMDACKKDKDGDVVGLEGFTGKSGFTGDMFTFRQNENQKSASAGNVVFKATKTTSNMSPHGSYAEAAASGSDEVLNGGCAMPIYGPTFTETWDEHNCSTKLSVYSPMVSVPNPVKSVNNSHGYYDGDACDWMISQGLNVLYRDIYMPYTQMIFRDTFDANLTVTGIDVYKDSVAAANRLGTGNYTYSLSGQTVTVTMSPSYLANTSIYNGGSIILVVHTKVKANGLNKATIPNTGSVTLSGVSCNTNTVAIRPWYRVYVTHEGSGSTDPAEKKEQIEWNASQKVTYAPSKDWYMKEMYYGSQKGYTDSGKGGLTHVGGSDLKVNSKLTQYTFTGINEDKHLHAVFVPIPELTVQKVISGDRKSYDTFGSPLFYYQIRGTDYLGDTHTWYWNIQNEGRVTRKVPAGDYTVRELPVSRYFLKAVDNIKNFTGLSVNDRKGTCNLKDGLPTDRPGDSAGDGYIKFTNELTDWEDYSHNSQAENRLK